MNKIVSIVFSGLFLVSCASYPTSSNAAEKPNILIMGEDTDKDTVPRKSRVFNRVLDALSNELHNEGFNVYDEVAVTVDDFTQGRTRRSDAEIIDVARSVKKVPIDVSVIFAIYASAERLSYTTKIRSRITGRLLNVKSGQRMGNFEVELPQVDNAPKDCDRECILEVVGKNSKILAHDLGAVLSEKLASMVQTTNSNASPTTSSDEAMATGYSLVFSGFTSEDIDGAEEYIVAFSGYKHHRPVRVSKRNAEYWYESSSDEARLNRNMRKMLERLGISGRITFAGNTFTVQKIGMRKKAN